VRLLGLVPSLLLAFLLGQARPTPRAPRGRADAGPVLLGTDPPGQLRPPVPTADAGASAQRDGAVDDLRRELQRLRARLDALEQERARAQEDSQRLQQLVQEVQQLRQQVADAEAQRLAAEQARDVRGASVQSAVDALYTAQQRLAGGNGSIEAELDQAQSAFTGQAQRDIEAARAALRNRDLSVARALLSAAIYHAQAGR
jgi:hypothetical protein